MTGRSGQAETATTGPTPDIDAAAMRRRLRAAAHELRTPLNGMTTIVDLLAASDLTPQTAAWVALLRDAIHQMSAVTNDVLDLGRLEADLALGAEDDFSPSDLFRSVVGLAAERAKAKGLDIALHLGVVPATVRGYPVMLRRVVENLVDNAIKHTDRGGIEVRLVSAGQVLVLTVADTGAGIAPADRARLFEPYVQLDGGRRVGGTGLGLTLAKASIDRLGGTIAVDGAVGIGTTFTVMLPVSAARGTTDDARPTPTTRPRQVLVADDNAVNRIVAAAILGGFGHAVRFAADGRAAVDAARATAFDVILMDLDMPGLDGREALLRLRQLDLAWPAPRVIAVSAQGDDSRDEIMAMGFDDYVPKPIEPARLWAAIEATR